LVEELTFEAFRNAILEKFEVPGITIMYEDQYVTSQADLDSILASKQTTYKLALYDEYDPNAYYDQYYSDPNNPSAYYENS
jgi:hypothetical protein